MKVVIDTVRRAFDPLKLTGTDIAAGVFTLAGADWPEDHANRQRVLEAAGISRRVIVKNDSFGGLRAGTNKPYGIVLAAGSGMNAAGITPDGREWAFGYYETFGGARSLAQDIFHAVLRAEDGRGKATMLTRLVLARLEFPTVEAMLRAFIAGKIDRRRFLTIAPAAFEASLAGDEVAVDIIIRQGEGLAEYANALIRRFDMHDLAFDVVLAGSIFKGTGPLLIDTIIKEVHRDAPRASIIRARFEPAVGSVLLAYDALGITVDEAMYANLSASVPAEDFFSTVKVTDLSNE